MPALGADLAPLYPWERNTAMVLDLDTAASKFSGSVLAIGTFDGVHLAHQELLKRAGARAREEKTALLALTFDPHPKEVLMPRPPPRLTSLTEKARRLQKAGADGVCALAFDKTLAQVPGAEFVERILFQKLQAVACFVGYNFSFGRGGKGRPEDLTELARRHSIDVGVLPVLDVGGIPISSTSIRTLLACGDVSEAALRLGGPHVLEGKVVHGDGRGKSLGFPTANLSVEPENLLIPKRGVYAGFASGDSFSNVPAVMNIGDRPTFEEASGSSIEVHCLGSVRDDFYGQPLRFAFHHRLRDETQFESKEALGAQIAQDVERAQGLLTTSASGKDDA